MKNKKETRGGKRPFSGRKSIYMEKTKVYSICLPLSKYQEIVDKIKKITNKYKVKYEHSAKSK
jgi:hypothetical protein